MGASGGFWKELQAYMSHHANCKVTLSYTSAGGVVVKKECSKLSASEAASLHAQHLPQPRLPIIVEVSGIGDRPSSPPAPTDHGR